MGTQGKTLAAVVSTGVEGEPAYPMYVAESVSPDGAFLAGPLLLEPGERFTVELVLAEGEALRVPARVSRVQQGDAPGMDVAFSDLSEDTKRKLNGRID